MAFAVLPRGSARDRSASAAWLALILAAAAVSCVTFACVTPFAAFAVVTAATMPWRRALAVSAAIWLINQAIGYGALGYPLDALSFAWGGAIGIAALAATATAAGLMRRRDVAWPRVALGFAAALAAYEGLLFLVSLGLGGSQNFAPIIVAQVALANAGWLVGLAILGHLSRRAAGIRRDWRHAVTT